MNRLTIILLIALSATILTWILQARANERRTQELEFALASRDREVSYWRDKEGYSRANAAVISGTLDALKEVEAAHYAELRAQFAGLNRRLTNLRGDISLSTHTVYDTTRVALVDNSFAYQSRWLDFSGRVSEDSIHLNSIVSRDSIQLVQYETKEGTRVEAVSYNPYTTLTGLRSTLVKTKAASPWVVGPQVGITVRDGLTVRPYVGVGVTYNVLRKR